jgi:hypothetical protein
MRRREVGR